MFHSGINLIFNCDVIKTGSLDRGLHFARPLGLTLFAFNDLFVEAKVQLLAL